MNTATIIGRAGQDAESKEEALKEYNRQVQEHQIDFSDLEMVDSSDSLEGPFPKVGEEWRYKNSVENPFIVTGISSYGEISAIDSKYGSSLRLIGLGACEPTGRFVPEIAKILNESIEMDAAWEKWKDSLPNQAFKNKDNGEDER